MYTILTFELYGRRVYNHRHYYKDLPLFVSVFVHVVAVRACAFLSQVTMLKGVMRLVISQLLFTLAYCQDGSENLLSQDATEFSNYAGKTSCELVMR